MGSWGLRTSCLLVVSCGMVGVALLSTESAGAFWVISSFETVGAGSGRVVKYQTARVASATNRPVRSQRRRVRLVYSCLMYSSDDFESSDEEVGIHWSNTS